MILANLCRGSNASPQRLSYNAEPLICDHKQRKQKKTTHLTPVITILTGESWLVQMNTIIVYFSYVIFNSDGWRCERICVRLCAWEAVDRAPPLCILALFP